MKAETLELLEAAETALREAIDPLEEIRNRRLMTTYGDNAGRAASIAATKAEDALLRVQQAIGYVNGEIE